MRGSLCWGLMSFYSDWVETFVRPSVRLDWASSAPAPPPPDSKKARGYATGFLS